MKRLYLIFSSICIFMIATAMDKKLVQINSIKKCSDYLYSDITTADLDNAVSTAYDQLQQEVLNWALSEGFEKPENISATDINKMADTIMTRRVEMYRVFAYISKEKVCCLFRGERVIKDSLPLNSDHEEPTMQGESVIQQRKDTVVSDSVLQLLKGNYLGRKGGVLEKIRQAKNFFELKDIMEPLKEQGEIIDYGKFSTMDNPEKCYMIIYDMAGNIRALLGTGTDSRWNLTTNREDHIANYRGCGAIWFIINE